MCEYKDTIEKEKLGKARKLLRETGQTITDQNHILFTFEEWKEIDKVVGQLEDVLQTYASPDEWTDVVYCYGEDDNGADWEFEYFIGIDKVFARDEHGYRLAQKIFENDN